MSVFSEVQKVSKSTYLPDKYKNQHDNNLSEVEKATIMGIGIKLFEQGLLTKTVSAGATGATYTYAVNAVPSELFDKINKVALVIKQSEEMLKEAQAIAEQAESRCDTLLLMVEDLRRQLADLGG